MNIFCDLRSLAARVQLSLYLVSILSYSSVVCYYSLWDKLNFIGICILLEETDRLLSFLDWRTTDIIC